MENPKSYRSSLLASTAFRGLGVLLQSTAIALVLTALPPVLDGVGLQAFIPAAHADGGDSDSADDSADVTTASTDDELLNSVTTDR